MAGANLRRIGVAHDWDLLRVRHVGRAVPALAFGVLRVGLDELGEVATVAESGRNRAHVGLKSIGADLEALTLVAWRKPSIKASVVAWLRRP